MSTERGQEPGSRQTRGVNHAALLRLVTGFLGVVPHCWYFKVGGGSYQRPGLPDLIAAIRPPVERTACGDALFVAIEVKTAAATLGEQQARIRQEIEGACGLYVLVRRIEDLQDALLLAGLLERPLLA